MATVEIVENGRGEVALIKSGLIFKSYWMISFKEWTVFSMWYTKNGSTLKDLKDAFENIEELSKKGSKRIKRTLKIKEIRGEGS